MPGQDSDTKLLLHLNGADGATTTTDATERHSTITFEGTAQLDTAQKKFGSSSLELDGDSDYLTIPDSTDWDIVATTTEDWTIDLWVRHASPGGSEYYATQDEGLLNTDRWILGHFSTGIRFTIITNNILRFTLFGGIISDSNWHHVALVKKGTDYGLYLDGTQTAYGSSSFTATFSSILYISSTTAYMNGWLDEFRIQKSNYFEASPDVGETDTITVPTEEYTDQDIIISENLVVSETIQKDVLKNITEAIVLNEVVVASPSNINLDISESIELTESIVTLVQNNLTISELIEFTESVVAITQQAENVDRIHILNSPDGTIHTSDKYQFAVGMYPSVDAPIPPIPEITTVISFFYRMLFQRINASQDFVFNYFNGRHYRKFD